MPEGLSNWGDLKLNLNSFVSDINGEAEMKVRQYKYKLKLSYKLKVEFCLFV